MTTAERLSEGHPVEVRAYEPADEAGVLEVLQAAFGRWPHGIEDVDAIEFFRWKMLECPFGPSASVVAVHEGQVVGFLGQLRWQFRLQGQPVLSTRGVDLGVEPGHRRLGVSTALTRWAMENHHTQVALAWNNPNGQSRPGLMRTARRKLVVVPRFVQPHGALVQTLVRACSKAVEHARGAAG